MEVSEVFMAFDEFFFKEPNNEYVNNESQVKEGFHGARVKKIWFKVSGE